MRFSAKRLTNITKVASKTGIGEQLDWSQSLKQNFDLLDPVISSLGNPLLPHAVLPDEVVWVGVMPEGRKRKILVTGSVKDSLLLDC